MKLCVSSRHLYHLIVYLGRNDASHFWYRWRPGMDHPNHEDIKTVNQLTSWGDSIFSIVPTRVLVRRQDKGKVFYRLIWMPINDILTFSWYDRICVSMYVSICLCLYVCVYVSMSVSLCLCLYVCLYVSMSVSMSLYLCLYVCVFMSLSLCLHYPNHRFGNFSTLVIVMSQLTRWPTRGWIQHRERQT